MKKSVNLLLLVLIVALLFSLSSLSCSSNGKGGDKDKGKTVEHEDIANVEGKTFKHSTMGITINFTTKSNFVFKMGEGNGESFNGTYTVVEKKITCEWEMHDPITGISTTDELVFDIINANEIKDERGEIWNKV